MMQNYAIKSLEDDTPALRPKMSNKTLPPPMPPDSPYVDSSDDEDIPPASHNNLRSSIAELSNAKLRSILVKLADTNSRWKRTIAKEVACARIEGDSPPMSTASSPKRRSKIRHKNRRASHTITQLHLEPLVNRKVAYHPGHLDEEVYEFLPHTHHQAVLSEMRVIKMWTCCDEDEWSPGCRRLSIDNEVTHNELGDSDVPYDDHNVFPDSELERRSEDDAHEALTPASAHEPLPM